MKINEFENVGVTQQQLDALEKVLDRVFSKVGIDIEFTRHFIDRVNDERNVKPISIKELAMLFKKEFIKYGKPIAQLGPDAQAVMKDLETDINIPFALEWNGKELELIAKTVMRKKNFKTPNKEFPVEGYGSKKALANLGGYGSKKKQKTVGDGLSEDLGSLPPLHELIIMAVLAKTTVDIIKGMFKAAVATGKGVKKLNNLRKKVKQMGQGIADYAMPESIDEETREELVSRLKDKQKTAFYNAALKALDALVKAKGSRQSVGGYAFDIARTFSGINSKELERMYNQVNEWGLARKQKVTKQSDPLTVLDTLSSRNDDINFPIKFYDGDMVKVNPTQARRFMNAYLQMEPEKRDMIDKYIKTKNGFKQAIKSLDIREDAFDLLSAALDWKK